MRARMVAVAAWIAVLGLAVGVAATGAGGDGGRSAAPVLPLPEPGAAAAEFLPDGAPVFVVRHADDEVSVLSAVDTHLGGLVVWCPGARVFVQPGPASRWDAYGRYSFGPAWGGLAPYRILEVGADHVVVGGRLPEPKRSEDGTVRADECVHGEGAGGVAHRLSAFGEVFAAESAPPNGRFVALRGWLHAGDDVARMCSQRVNGRCPATAPPITSQFFDRIPLTQLRGVVQTTVLARARPNGSFSDLIWSRPGDLLNLEWVREPTPFVDSVVSASVVGIASSWGRRYVVLDQPVQPESFGRDTGRVPGAAARFRLADHVEVWLNASPTSADDLGITDIVDLSELEERLQTSPLDAELYLSGTGVVRSIVERR